MKQMKQSVMASIKVFKRTSGYIRQLIYGLHPLTMRIDPHANRRWIVHRCMISNTWRYCYFRIPKSAGSTIARSLAYYDPKTEYNPDNDIMGRTVKKESLSLLYAEALTVFGLAKKYFLFTFVRNPYTRVLSAYIDKIANLENTAFGSTRNYIMAFSASKRNFSFETFIQYLEKGGLYKNPHWMPQTAMFPVSINKIHFIGKVENLNSDLEYVINHIYGKGVFKKPLTREHGRTDSAVKLSQYYDKELLDRIYKLYESDFVSFSYPRNLL